MLKFDTAPPLIILKNIVLALKNKSFILVPLAVCPIKHLSLFVSFINQQLKVKAVVNDISEAKSI